MCSLILASSPAPFTVIKNNSSPLQSLFISNKIMIVTKQNFSEAKEKFKQLVKQASFVSLDLELSGIDYSFSQDHHQKSNSESVQGTKDSN